MTIPFASIEDGNPFPLLLLHGLGGCSYEWSGVAKRLPQPALVTDAPYHGGRGVEGELTFPAFARDAVQAANARGFERFVVAGTSMGAATALTVASLFPERVAGLLLVAPAWHRERYPPNLERLRKLGRIMLARGIEHAWKIVEALPPVSGWADGDRAGYRDRFLAYEATATGVAMRDLPGELPLIDPVTCHRLRHGCLTVSWRHDPIHPPHVANAVAKSIGADPPLILLRPRDLGDEQRMLAELAIMTAYGEVGAALARLTAALPEMSFEER